MSRVSLVKMSANIFAVEFDCWLDLRCSIPSFLLPLFPKSKKRTEAMIAGGIVKMAKTEVAKGVDAARQAIIQEFFDTNATLSNVVKSEL